MMNGHVFAYEPSENKENKLRVQYVGHKLLYFVVAPKGAVCL